MSVAVRLVVVASLAAGPVAAGAVELPPAIADHPVWREAEMSKEEPGDAIRRYLRRGGAEPAVVRLLDVLDEARSPVAEGDHGPALVALLELPRGARRPLRRWVDDRREQLLRARAGSDVDALRQLQTRVSVVVSELAGRRADLSRRPGRRAALRDLRRLSEFAETALWERHALNWRLRGPLRMGTAAADRALDRYYRRREYERFSSSDRAGYLKVLSRVEGGGFDAINAYDRGGISVGIAQFSASSPFLGRLLQHLDRERPKLFRRHVADRGLSIDSDGWLHLGDRALIPAIREMSDQNEFNAVLLAFIECLEVPRLRRSLYRQQVVLADGLLDRAMALSDPEGIRLSDALRSARGRTHLADAFINTGADDTLDAFRAARERSRGGDGLVDAFIDARRRFYEGTGQGHLRGRIEAIERMF